MPRHPRYERPSSTVGSRARDEEERRQREALASSGDDPAEYSSGLIADTFKNMGTDAYENIVEPFGEALGDAAAVHVGAWQDNDLGYLDMYNLLDEREKTNLLMEGALGAAGVVAAPIARAVGPTVGRLLRRGAGAAEESTSILPSFREVYDNDTLLRDMPIPDDVVVRHEAARQRPRYLSKAERPYDPEGPPVNDNIFGSPPERAGQVLDYKPTNAGDEYAEVLRQEWEGIETLSQSEKDIWNRQVADERRASGDLLDIDNSGGLEEAGDFDDLFESRIGDVNPETRTRTVETGPPQQLIDEVSTMEHLAKDNILEGLDLTPNEGLDVMTQISLGNDILSAPAKVRNLRSALVRRIESATDDDTIIALQRQVDRLEGVEEGIRTNPMFRDAFDGWDQYSAKYPNHEIMAYHLVENPHEIKMLTGRMRLRINRILERQTDTLPYGEDGKLIYIREEVLNYLDQIDNYPEGDFTPEMVHAILQLPKRINIYENRY
jgi:hypothetical protein